MWMAVSKWTGWKVRIMWNLSKSFVHGCLSRWKKNSHMDPFPNVHEWLSDQKTWGKAEAMGILANVSAYKQEEKWGNENLFSRLCKWLSPTEISQWHGLWALSAELLQCENTTHTCTEKVNESGNMVHNCGAFFPVWHFCELCRKLSALWLCLIQVIVKHPGVFQCSPHLVK